MTVTRDRAVTFTIFTSHERVVGTATTLPFDTEDRTQWRIAIAETMERLIREGVFAPDQPRVVNRVTPQHTAYRDYWVVDCDGVPAGHTQDKQMCFYLEEVGR